MVALRRLGANRPFLLFIVLAVGLIAVAIRLAVIQTIASDRYVGLAEDQRLRQIEIQPRRGQILDRDGEELAVSIDAATIYASPNEIEDLPKTVSVLAPILGIPESDIFKRLTSSQGCCFVYIARQVDEAKGEQIKSVGLPGIGVLDEPRRHYQYGPLAAQVIGFSGTDNEGLSGLELYANQRLRGQSGTVKLEVDPLGRPIPGGIYQRQPPVDGTDIRLTIDKDIQYKAEEELRAAVKTYEAKGGSVVVLNPKTGEIYAMANEPTLNINYFSKADPDSYRNRALTDLYEPGSVMKPVIAAAALEERIAEPDTVFHLPSELSFGNQKIGEAHERPAAEFTFSDIIVKSSNVGIVTVGMKLGKENIYSYLEIFGLTQETGVDFPGEAGGDVPKPANWSQTSIANVPFGQGIAVSLLQVAQAFAIIANDGQLATPHLLKDTELTMAATADAGGTDGRKRMRGRKLISKQTIDKMQSMLTEVVTRGTGRSAAIPGYKVAGKTGTAQKPKDGKYGTGSYVASFAGFAPVDDPEVVVAVMIDEPKGAYYGGVVAGPVFQAVTEFSLRHLMVPPSDTSVVPE